jgi:hypothetical protein
MKKIFFSIVGYNAAEIFLIFELKYFQENKFFNKMILTHEPGAQEDQFDEKKGQKSRGTIPLKIVRELQVCSKLALRRFVVLKDFRLH